MRQLKIVTVAVALMASVSVAFGEEVKSGLQEGDQIGAFYVTKLAGAEDDGVKVDQNLCYRCKNGGRPQVMVFTRAADDKVVQLLQKLDGALAENEDKQLRAFVNVMAEDKDAATEHAKQLAETSKTKHIPFVVPNEFQNGPDNYGINPDAAVTVILAEGGKVKANRAFSSAEEVEVESVIGDLKKILN